MRLLSVTDRLSIRGGADLHLRDVLEAAAGAGMAVTLAVGRVEPGVRPPAGVQLAVIRGLARMVSDPRRLGRLGPLLDQAEVIHAQNVMNPIALSRIVQTGRAIITVQDHRVFCPGAGKTLPDGAPCVSSMSADACGHCLPEPSYRARMLALTQERQHALHGARLVVLSQYMAQELAQAGLGEAAVIPPWIPVDAREPEPGVHFVLGGRLVAHKDSLRGWQAWQDAERPLPLVVAGDGPLLAALDGTQRPGWLDRGALRTVLHRARALIFPARWQEPFGILGAEALACGTPVILTPRGGMGDWARAGCIHATDSATLTQAIRALADDPTKALALGRAGRDHIRDRFSEATLTTRLWALYDTVRC